MDKVMRARPQTVLLRSLLSGLCVLVSGCGPQDRVEDRGQNLGRLASPKGGEGALVSVQITVVGGSPVLAGRPEPIDEHALIEGEVQNLPEGAGVWVATNTGDDLWVLGGAPAQSEPWGTWYANGSLDLKNIADGQIVDIVAIVTENGAAGARLTEAALARSSYKISRPIRTVIDRSMRTASSLPMVEISSLAGRQVLPAEEPVIVPESFSIQGRSRNLRDGTWILMFLRGPDAGRQWTFLEAGRCDKAGEWSVPLLSVPSSFLASQGKLVIMGVASRNAPPDPGSGIDVVGLTRAVRSRPVRIIASPLFLRVADLVDCRGARYPVSTRWDDVPTRLAAELAEARILVDGIPRGSCIWLLVRPEGWTSWLVFGPGQSVAPSELLVRDARIVLPGAEEHRQLELLAVASSSPLGGRLLSGADLADVILGASPTIHVEPPPHETQADRARLRITYVDGVPVAGLDGTPRKLRAGMTQVRGVAQQVANGAVVSVGLEDPENGRWSFSRAMRIEPDGWVATVPVPRATRFTSSKSRTSRLVGVLADFGSSRHAVDLGWWESQAAAQTGPLPVILPPPTLSELARQMTMDSHQGGSPMTPLASWLLAALGIGVVAALVALFLRRNWCHVWIYWNSRCDGRKNQPPSDAVSPGEMEQRIRHVFESRIARIKGHYGTKVAALSAELNRLNAELTSELEPSCNQTRAKVGRRDPDLMIPRRFGLTLLFVLTIGEFAFNVTAFDILLRPRAETILIALAVCLSIPICALFVGLRLRRWPHERAAARRSAFAVATLVAMMIVLFHYINKVRIAYLRHYNPEDTKLEIAFFVFNAAVFAATALTTYMSHDPEAGFEKTHRAMAHARQQIARAERSTVRLAGRQEAEIDGLRAHAEECLAYYRQVNRRYRGTPPPSYFNDPATLEL